LQLEPPAASESDEPENASLFDQPEMSPHEKKLFSLIKADEAIHIDELVEKLEGKLSSSEIFSALFELEMGSKIRQLAGKQYVRIF